MTKRLAGKVALVTGGSRGLGRGIAEAYAGEGANIIVNFVKDSAAADAVVTQVKALGADAIAIKADVGDQKAVQGMVDAGASSAVARSTSSSTTPGCSIRCPLPRCRSRPGTR